MAKPEPSLMRGIDALAYGIDVLSLFWPNGLSKREGIDSFHEGSIPSLLNGRMWPFNLRGSIPSLRESMPSSFLAEMALVEAMASMPYCMASMPSYTECISAFFLHFLHQKLIRIHPSTYPISVPDVFDQFLVFKHHLNHKVHLLKS